jgi:UDP-N-acetylmuramoyl-tripeptide--D-alanyl-D-alanine ligase
MRLTIESLYSVFLKHPVISTDTRDVRKDSIFFALKGANFNANNFAFQAIELGCTYAIIDEKEFELNDQFILVDDVLKSLQELASFHRNKLTIPIIGITGTNGKTTTKELLNSVLSEKYYVLATKGNLNNHIGVPLTLLGITKETEIAIIEMGANHIGEIAELCEIALPNFGIITNIGKAHLEGFGSIVGVIKTKKALYESVKKNNGKLFVNAENKMLVDLVDDGKAIYYSDKNSDYTGEIVEMNPFLKLVLKIKNETIGVQTNLVGKYNFENIMAAVCIGSYFDVSPNQIKKAIENYFPSNNRSQVKQSDTNTLILDAYNANPSSMLVSINNFNDIPAKRKVVIIGDMRELGAESQYEHHEILKLINLLKFDDVIIVGNEFFKFNKDFNFKFFSKVEEAFVFIQQNPISDSTILLKGSRGIKLETLNDLL